MEDIYRWIEVEAYAELIEADKDPEVSCPKGYEHQFGFKVTQMIPRRALDIEAEKGKRTLAELGGLTGGANLVVEGLKLGDAGHASDSDEEIISD